MIYMTTRPELFSSQLAHSDISDELYHHGIKGQRWGVRRYQNLDGSWTDEGRRRYGFGYGKHSSVTQNTKRHINRGAGIGAAAGSIGLFTLGAIESSGYIGSAANAIPALLAIGSIPGAALGIGVGAVAGALATSYGRRYMMENDVDLERFDREDTQGNRVKIREGKQTTRIN